MPNSRAKKIRLAVAALLVVATAVTLPLTLTGGRSAPASTSPVTLVERPGSHYTLAHYVRLNNPPAVGTTLHASTGGWSSCGLQASGYPLCTFTYQWQRCNTSGANCVAITSATAATYLVAAADVGFTLRVGVVADNGTPGAPQYSAVTQVVPGGGTGSLLFQSSFENPINSGVRPQTLSDWGGTPQCANTKSTTGSPTGQNAGAAHYFGDIYSDNGTSSSPTLGRVDLGSQFNLASASTVAPGAGSWSMRYLIPVTPSGYNRTSCALLGTATQTGGALNNANDLGQTKYYGIMVYAPTGETLNAPGSQGGGSIIWEFHFNAVWGDALALALVANPTGGGGVGGWSEDVQLETGACNPAGSTAPGCVYRSHDTTCTNLGSVGGVPVTCIQGPLYAVPPGSVTQGQWQQIILAVRWATDTSGFYQFYWKNKSDTTWNVRPIISGIPTVQWNVNTYGATCAAGTACGYPNYEAVEYYSANALAPYSFNVDNVLVGTTLSAVQTAMGGGAVGTPVNTALPAISGSTVSGSTLTASTGSWTNTPTSYGYQWQDCNSSGASCAAIGGATASTHVLTSGEIGGTVRVVVTATNGTGAGTPATSNQTAAISGVSIPVNTALPTISGATTSGATLTAADGSWTNTPTSYSRIWQQCAADGTGCSTITGQTATTYVLGGADIGHTIRVVVTATNATGSGTPATSAATAVVSGTLGTGGSLATCSGACTAPTLAASWTNISAPGSGCKNASGTNDSCPTRIYVPGNLNAHDATHPVPLVFVFPQGTNADQNAGIKDWVDQAAADRIIVVDACYSIAASCVPNDTEFRGGGAVDGTAETKQVEAIIAYMEGLYAIDTSRIFAQGGSKGGNATADVACDPYIEPSFAGVSVLSNNWEAGSSAANAPFASGHCRAFVNSGTQGAGGVIASPHRLMFQFIYSPDDNATWNGCWVSNHLCTSVNSGDWYYSTAQFQTAIFQPGEGCDAVPVSRVYDPEAVGLTGQITSASYENCGALSSGGQARSQGISIRSTNGVATCHYSSCTDSVGIYSFNIATAAWAYWTTGTETPS